MKEQQFTIPLPDLAKLISDIATGITTSDIPYREKIASIRTLNILATELEKLNAITSSTPIQQLHKTPPSR